MQALDRKACLIDLKVFCKGHRFINNANKVVKSSVFKSEKAFNRYSFQNIFTFKIKHLHNLRRNS